MLLSAHIESQCLTYAGFFMVLVLLSASVKKVGVSRMRDFLFYFYPCIVLSELNTSQGDLFCHTLTFSRNIMKLFPCKITRYCCYIYSLYFYTRCKNCLPCILSLLCQKFFKLNKNICCMIR